MQSSYYITYVSVRTFPNSNSDKASNDGSLEDGQMDKLIQLESRQPKIFIYLFSFNKYGVEKL